MKLLQINVWTGRLEPQVLQFIKAEDPDIICLQEAISIKGGESLIFASIEDIQAVLGASYAFMSPVLSLNLMNRKADFGNCIISKYPIKGEETIFTGKQYVDNFDIVDHEDINMRNLQHVVITLPDGSEMHILNHHGHHINQHKNGDAETMRQCGLIADIIKKLDGRLILAGDFNLAPHSESLEQINSLLINLPIKYDLKTTRTSLTHKSEVCDYIFVSDDVNVESFEALDDIVSDHKALRMTFR